VPISFPSSPLLNDVYTYSGRSWTWNGEVWLALGTVQGTTGVQGPIGIGFQGIQGPLGIQGTQGIQGESIQGLQGNQGPNAAIYFDANPPVSPLLGDRWVDSNSGIEYTYLFDGTNNAWVEVSASGFSGIQGTTGTQGVSSPITNSGTTTAAVIGINAATTSVVGAVQLEDSVSSTSVVKAATPNSVRTAYVLGSGFLANYQTKVGQTSSTIDVPDRYNVLHSYNGYSGYITFSFFTPLETMTISQITMGNSSIPAASCTAARMGLYTFDGTTATLVARTANDTTLFNSIYTSYTRSLSTTGGYPSTYTLTSGTRYAFAYIVVAATMPTIYNAPLGDNNAGVIGALSPRISGVRTGQTDLLASTTINGPSDQVPWFRGS